MTYTESLSPSMVTEKGAGKAAESEVEVEYDEDYEYEEELNEGIIIGTQTSRVSVHPLFLLSLSLSSPHQKPHLQLTRPSLITSLASLPLSRMETSSATVSKASSSLPTTSSPPHNST